MVVDQIKAIDRQIVDDYVNLVDIETIQEYGPFSMLKANVIDKLDRILRRQEGNFSGYFADRAAKHADTTFTESDLQDAWANEKPVISPIFAYFPLESNQITTNN